MQLVINTWGSYLKKKENCFLIKNEDKVFEVSVKKVDSILITTSAYFSTDAIKLALDNNIDIAFLDSFGNPYGRVWHSRLGSTNLIRRCQLEHSVGIKGLELAKEWIIKKIDNQISLLNELKNSRKNKAEQLQIEIDNIMEKKLVLQSIQGVIEEQRNKIMITEAVIAKGYFLAINYIMPEQYKFEGRSRNPAKDEFNCLLNYGYGVLYSLVEKSCILAGLDPYIGFLHTDNYNKKSFVFDLIEPIRPLIDKTVIHLFSKRQVKKEHFDRIRGGLTLNKEGKTLLITAYNETMDKAVKYRGRNIKNRNIIELECHHIANSFIKGSKE